MQADRHTDGEVGDERRRGFMRGYRLSSLIERFGLLIVWMLVIVFFGVQAPSTFLTFDNFSTMFGSQAVLLMLTLALLVPLTAGDYDLSVASILTLSSMLIAYLNVNDGWPIGLAILAALAAGVIVGLINGLVITFFNIESLIVTLGTGTILNGLVLWLSGSSTISGVSSTLVTLVVEQRFLGIPLEFYYGLALTIVLWYVFEFTAPGRRLLFVGRGRAVARLSGLRVEYIRVVAMVVSGAISALAGALYVGTIGAADPTSGLAYLLPAFAAAFLGTTTIVPGRFNPWGSFTSVYFLVTGITGLTILGAENYVTDIFYGAALVVGVVLSQVARWRSARRARTT